MCWALLQPRLCLQQELPQPELQPLATEAKGALALLKYLPLPAALLPQVAAALSEGVRAELWPARAAALVFAQVQCLNRPPPLPWPETPYLVPCGASADPACRGHVYYP